MCWIWVLLPLAICRNMMDNVREISLFFSNSSKRQRVLETLLEQSAPSARVKKLKSLCKTWWAKRHLCFDTLYELFGVVSSTLELIFDSNLIEIENVDPPVDWDKGDAREGSGIAKWYEVCCKEYVRNPLRHELGAWKRKWTAVDSIDLKFDTLICRNCSPLVAPYP